MQLQIHIWMIYILFEEETSLANPICRNNHLPVDETSNIGVTGRASLDEIIDILILFYKRPSNEVQ